jgi:hypothetical protein
MPAVVALEALREGSLFSPRLKGRIQGPELLERQGSRHNGATAMVRWVYLHVDELGLLQDIDGLVHRGRRGDITLHHNFLDMQRLFRLAAHHDPIQKFTTKPVECADGQFLLLCSNELLGVDPAKVEAFGHMSGICEP